MMLVPPIAHLAEITIDQANTRLEAWGHEMGGCNRPNGQMWAHALFHNNKPVALTVTASLIRSTCAGLTRDQAVELARLCAVRSDLCRVALRLWREFLFPGLAARHGWAWAVSYQDEAMHTGNTYRFDGWVRLGRSRSGTDSRSGRRGRNKTIWGWNPDAAERRARKTA